METSLSYIRRSAQPAQAANPEPSSLVFIPTWDDETISINHIDATLVWHQPSNAYIGLCFRIAGSKIVVFQPFQGSEVSSETALPIYEYFDVNKIPADKQHFYSKYDSCCHPDGRTVCIAYYTEWVPVEYEIYE